MQFKDGQILHSDNVFKAHSVKFVNAVTDSIELLDQPEKLKKVLNELGALHEQKNIPISGFTMFGNAFIATIQQILDRECSIEIVNFFSLFYNEGTNLMVDGYKNVNKSRPSMYNKVKDKSSN